MFKDITPLLLDPGRFRRALELMAAPFEGSKVRRVVSIESRGFLLGAPIALLLDAGLVPIRKPGKLPGARGRVEYALEYGTDALEMHREDRKSTRLNSSHLGISYAVFCLKKKKYSIRKVS